MFFWIIFTIELIFLFLTSKYIYQSLFIILHKLIKSRSISEKIIFLIFLPGVIVHELSHIFAAEVTFVKTFNLDISPKHEEGYLRMGTVEIQKTDAVRRAIIGVAPLISGVVIISSLFIFLNPYLGTEKIFTSLNAFYLHIGVGAVVFLITNTMFSSKKDLEGFIVFALTGAFLSLVLFVALVILNQNPVEIFNRIISSELSETLAKTASSSLIIPVLINGSMFLLANVFRGKV